MTAVHLGPGTGLANQRLQPTALGKHACGRPVDVWVFEPAPRHPCFQLGVVVGIAASGPLGCYLVKHGVVPPERAGTILSLQGVKMGRPSRVHIAIGVDAGEIARVQVGGEAVLMGEGYLEL